MMYTDSSCFESKFRKIKEFKQKETEGEKEILKG